MDQEIFVYMDLGSHPVFTGTLWIHAKRGRQSASFEYSRQWMQSPMHFSLEPSLMLGPGTYHSSGGLFGAISDSAPDRWGRVLMERMEMRRAKIEKRRPRTLLESDYLLRVNDLSRQGALRFSLSKDGPFLTEYTDLHIPPLVELGNLLAISNRLINKENIGPELKDLVAPGSSLGGARPKASVQGNNSELLIAKFNSPKDDWDVELWEAISFQMAKQAGIPVPGYRVLKVLDENVLILNRFDRNGPLRIPFLSAMSMLGAADGEVRSYLDLGESIIEYGSRPSEDIKDLWKRIVFNILISNVDDHLRNHGFLFDGISGWRLSPVYDLEPTPEHVKARFLSTNISEDDSRASIELAFEVAQYFGIKPNEARNLTKEVGESTKRWHVIAGSLGVSRQEVELMSSAFEHDELKVALKG